MEETLIALKIKKKKDRFATLRCRNIAIDERGVSRVYAADFEYALQDTSRELNRQQRREPINPHYILFVGVMVELLNGAAKN